MADNPKFPFVGSQLAASVKALNAIPRPSPVLDPGFLRPSPALENMAESHRATMLLAEIAGASTALEFCKRLDIQIRKFESELDQEHEVGVSLVSFGRETTFHVTGLGFANPSLIYFNGFTAGGQRTQLMQHVTQINFMLVAMEKPDPEQPARRFGFAQGHAEHIDTPTGASPDDQDAGPDVAEA